MDGFDSTQFLKLFLSILWDINQHHLISTLSVQQPDICAFVQCKAYLDDFLSYYIFNCIKRCDVRRFNPPKEQIFLFTKICTNFYKLVYSSYIISFNTNTKHSFTFSMWFVLAYVSICAIPPHLDVLWSIYNISIIRFSYMNIISRFKI